MLELLPLLIFIIPLLYVAYEKTMYPKPTDWLPYGLKWKESFKEEFNRKIEKGKK